MNKLYIFLIFISGKQFAYETVLWYIGTNVTSYDKNIYKQQTR